MSSGLLRYRSAPSTILQDTCEDFIPVRPTSPETESMFARFLAAPPDLRTQIRDKPTEQMAHFSASQMMYPAGSMAMDSDQIKTGSSGLIRHSSSPAGLNGYGLMRGSQAGRQINFSSRQNSLSQISEMGGSSPEESGEGGRGYIPGFPVGTWEESSMLSENFSGMKRSREVGGAKLGVGGLNQSESQFQDAVLCKMRAKRGCATHPRSIAERVRRTRISERMRKLQELVPNMDKQTNTADMLDLAVEYIKDLQGQVQTLSESRASCTCSSSKRKPYTNPSL